MTVYSTPPANSAHTASWTGKAFPLIKTRLSNERVMTALLLVLILFNIPRYLAEPRFILRAFFLIVLGLILDAGAGFLRFRRPVCAVSAAVTALLLQTLSPYTPFWGTCAALGVSLLIKHLWGGSGKNVFNPAVFGLLLLGLVFPEYFYPYETALLFLPAVLLFLPFLSFRPFAGIGMLLGMSAALLIRSEFTLVAFFGYGVFLWSFLIITDPVTTTSRPAAGAVISFITGFVPLMAGGSVTAMAFGVLASNILSFASDHFRIGGNEKLPMAIGRKNHIHFSKGSAVFIDLTSESSTGGSAPTTRELPITADASPLSGEEILERCEDNRVFGFGGAAFPTARKIRAVIDSETSDKHLIVNAVECDPGLIHDKWLLTNRLEDVLKGIKLLRGVLSFTSVTLAVKDPTGICVPAGVTLHKVRDYYPAGAERLLTEEVLKKQIPYDVYPASEGILILNVQTMISLYEAVCFDRMAATRYLTLADLDSRSGKVLRVKLGSGVFETVNKVNPAAVAVCTGGGIMNARLTPDGAVIGDSVNFLATGRIRSFREAPCSRCNICSSSCPANLPVRDIAQQIDDGRRDKAQLLGPEKCIACGLCSYVCLAGRNLAARVYEAKKQKKY
jgi:electron transport complex protein RnfC